jgi:hypothetical protein
MNLSDKNKSFYAGFRKIYLLDFFAGQKSIKDAIMPE